MTAARADVLRALFEHQPCWADAHPVMSTVKRAMTPREWTLYLRDCRPGPSLAELICAGTRERAAIAKRHGKALAEAFDGPVTLVVERSEIVIEPQKQQRSLDIGEHRARVTASANAPDGKNLRSAMGTDGSELSLSVEDFCARTGFCKSWIYAQIRAGVLPARKGGRRVVIPCEDAKRFLQSLPAASAAA